MLDNDELKPTRADFEAKVIKIAARGKLFYEEHMAAKARRSSKRGGARIRKTAEEKAKEFEFSQGVQSGRTYWKWYQQWKTLGDEGLFDGYRKCGGHSRYSDEVAAYVERLVDMLLDEERQTVSSIVDSITAAIEAENERRIRQTVPQAGMPVVGYDYIRKVIIDRAPLDHAIRQKGWDRAYKDFHFLGLGIETSRALERVKIDEYTVDLMVLMRDVGLFDHLPASVKQFIGLDGEPSRVTLSAAIDVHTRCLLALQIVPQGHESPLRDTVEMIYMDKAPISDAAGCSFTWHQGGAPEMIVLDRGARYVTDEAYAVLASLGITNMGAPAGKPWLKPFIERVFRTIHDKLLQNFSGRTFSNVVDRGENDPAKRATLTLEAFLCWLVRWTVDAYHTTTHSALGMSPNQAWDKAFKDCETRSISTEEMREAFGIKTHRKIGRHGVLVKHVVYQDDNVIRLASTPGVREVEVLRWHGDIGTIGIRHDDGPWMTVTAADPMWIGKNDIDLDVWLSKRQEEASDEQAARRRFINDMNAASYGLKALAGLISLPRTADELERDVIRFSRHTDTAQRRHDFGEHLDLLADLDDGAGSQPDVPANALPPASSISDDDLMD